MIDVALLGAGNRARKYLEYIIAHPDEARLVAVVEPNRLRRESVARKCQLPADALFESSDDFFARGHIADAVIIATPDKYHYPQAMSAIQCGYHILLEKPIAQTVEEAEQIKLAADRAGVIVNVCYVLHFHPYFVKLRELVNSGRYGQIVSISHSAPVGIDRAGHVYVRGIWNRSEAQGPLLTSKCCHDLDFLVWLTDSHCRSLSSFGSLRWFTSENAPAGSAERCIDCKTETTCPFSAIDLYRNRHAWISNFDVPNGMTINDAIEEQLANGPYGRCVYHCDNDVVDRQVVAMEMESGVTIDLTVDVFTTSNRRVTKISMTNAEIIGDEHAITIRKFRPRATETYDFSDTIDAPYHAGADLETVSNFLTAIRQGRDNSHTGIAHALESQRLCDAIEQSRLSHSSN